MEQRGKSGVKKGKLMTTRCFFPLLGNVSPCKSKASGRGLSYHAIVVSGVGTFQGVSVG